MGNYLEVSENKLKKILSTHRSYRFDIISQRRNYLRQIREYEDMIDLLSMPSIRLDTTPISKTNKKQDPTYESYVVLSEKRYTEKILKLQQSILELEQQEESLDRICESFHKLAWICPIAYRLATELAYVEPTLRTKTWDSMRLELGCSKSYISESLNCVYKFVKLLYDSDISTEALKGMSEDELIDYISEKDNSLLDVINKY